MKKLNRPTPLAPSLAAARTSRQIVSRHRAGSFELSKGSLAKPRTLSFSKITAVSISYNDKFHSTAPVRLLSAELDMFISGKRRCCVDVEVDEGMNDTGLVAASLKIFLINLDRADDRLAAMRARLGQIGLQFERVPAVDGGSIDFPTPEFSEFAFRFMHGRRRNPGEVGCYLSHVECARRLLASPSEFALVLEDDLEFPPDIIDILEAALRRAEQWDILRLSTVSCGRKFDVSRLTENRNLAIALTREKGSGAYIINRRAARWFAEKLLPMRLPFDLAFDLEFFQGLNSAFVTPVPINQQLGLPSQIQGKSQRRRYHRSRAHYLTVMPYRAFVEASRLFFRLWRLTNLRLQDRASAMRDTRNKMDAGVLNLLNITRIGDPR
ncbi:glycosyltransferase family 25 protein [Rhizobium sp. LEGMi12c]